MLAISPPDQQYPLVSILIAARNEEAIIGACLRAVGQLHYPANSIDVLIGNDQSTDQTATLVAGFVRDNPAFRLIDSTESVAGLAGKANVLAQLARQANGQYLFFTDADTQVSPDWLTEMLRSFTGNTGVVTGVTLPEGPSVFHKLQTLDWLYNLTLTHLVGSVGMPITAMGNNMAVSKEAYNAVGGYESLPFSVTEDYTLFRAILAKGYGFQTLLSESVLARTEPVGTFTAFLQQRKRWMRGATALPGWIVGFLYGNYLAGPLLLLIGWFSPVLAIGLYLSRLLIQTMVLSLGLSRLRQTRLWPYALLFDGYQLIIGPVAVVYYWLPTKIDWKGRKYA
ncbi:glycosyltransferase family 2 protein [Spirosoma luteum]|uniref:glycosyltransferase family 2 protein n=1 Tax=Spirosoma luteum TaxID=431553 RepID=UPI00036F09F7|nr:glycosyltransferase family 2 protein [Spirosoma luteum]